MKRRLAVTALLLLLPLWLACGVPQAPAAEAATPVATDAPGPLPPRPRSRASS